MTRSSGSEEWSFTIFHIYRRAVINKQANDFRVAPTGSERERTVAREVVPPPDLADIWVNAGAKRSSNRTYSCRLIARSSVWPTGSEIAKAIDIVPRNGRAIARVVPRLKGAFAHAMTVTTHAIVTERIAKEPKTTGPNGPSNLPPGSFKFVRAA